MEFLPILYAIVLVVLTVVLTVVGVYLVLVLQTARQVLLKVDQAIDVAETRLNSVIQPLQKLGGMTSGLTTGLKVFEAFVGWLQRNRG